MGSIQILLGKSRWRRRRALPHAHLSGVDPLGRPTFLYVTDTWRKKRVVEREFLAWRRDRPVFAPRVRVLSELLEELHLRHGRGGALLPDRVVALAGEQVLQAGAGQWPWLAALGGGPEVAGALAALYAQLAEARRELPADVPHAGELRGALGALGDRLGRIPGFVHPAAALEGLLEVLEAPPPALVQWLRATHSVVIDDVLQLSPLRSAALMALCRAWEAAGTHVVVAFESGRDLGGREVEAFFEYGDVDEIALPLKPFAATRSLRRALFDEVVARGSGGEILLARRDEVIPVEPWSVPETPEAPDLSDLVYGREPLPVATEAEARALLQGRVRLLRCDDPEAELRAVAGQVKRALLDGVEPGDCVVALPDLATYGPAVRAVFDDHGIPYALAAGARLAHSPVTNLVRQVARIALEGWPIDRVLPVLASDLVDSGVDAGWWHRAARGAGLAGGRPADWQPALASWLRRTERQPDLAGLHDEITRLDTLLAPLERLARPAAPDAWRATLIEVLEGLGVPERLGRGDDPAATAGNLHAWGAILAEVEALVRDLQVVDPGSWPPEPLAAHLDRALQRGVYHPEPPGSSRVQVVGVLELRGLTPRRTWLTGLHRTAFPAPRGTPCLIPRPLERRLDPVDPLAEARYLLGSLLRNVLDDGQMDSLVLSWPATLEGQPLAPSPVIADLLDRPTLHPEHLFGDLVVDAPAPPGHPLSRSGALRAAARRRETWRPVLAAHDAGLAELQAEVHAARQAPRPGPWEGVLDRRIPVAQPLAVTRLETYLQCPAKYAYRHVLGLRPPREWEPELDALRRGSAVHRILDRFLTERDHAPLRGADREPAAAHLHVVATRVIDAIAAQGGAEAAFVEDRRRRWLAGLVDDEPAGLLRAWLDHEIDGDLDLVPVATEYPVGPIPVGPVAVRGTIDRVDRLAGGGVLISDYKTGTPPRSDHVRTGLVLQPVAYAEALAAEFGDQPIGATYYQVKRPDRIGRKSWSGEPGVIDQAGRQRRSAVKLEPDDRRDLLAHAARAGERLLQGVFHTTLADPDAVKCSFCEFRRICRYRPDRAAELREGDADLQRPREAT